MSTCKSSKPKTELIAIYRLEFYKKQKNWKIGSSPYSKKSSKKSVDKKNDLNTTYNIEECSGTKEPSDPLNEAFVDFDCDNIQTQNVRSNLSIPKKHELSQQWLEPVNIWPDDINNNVIRRNKNVPLLKKDNNVVLKDPKSAKSEGYVEKPVRQCTMTRLQQLQKAVQLQEHQDNIQNILKKSMIDLQCKETNPNDQNHNREDYQGNNQYFCGLDNWSLQNREHFGAEHNIWPGEQDMDDQSEDIMYSAAWFPKPLSQFDNIPLATTSMVDLDDCYDLSVDSIGEFMRGADAAPHSSEMDLVLPSEVDVADVSFRALSRLSTEQLVLAARLHSRVLRRLLLESEQRQRLRRVADHPLEYSSLEEFEPRGGVDAFIAGSHLQPQPGLPESSLRSVGRGRGRLV